VVATNGTTRDLTFAYDLVGKRTSNTVNGASTTYTANADPAKDVNTYASITGLQAESGLTYDTDANMTANSFWTFTYDAKDRLKQAVRKDGTKTVQFLYDYLGRRVRKTVRNGNAAAPVAASTKFVWAGWKLIAELNAGTAETGSTFAASYLWGPDISGGAGAGGLLAVYQGGAKYYPVYDTGGNITGYLDGTTGTTIATYTYTAYGDVATQTGAAANFAYGMATQYTDRELTRMVYFGLRYYSALEGRFLTRDPIEEAGGINLFGFVGNSPTNGWDALGLDDYSGWSAERWLKNWEYKSKYDNAHEAGTFGILGGMFEGIAGQNDWVPYYGPEYNPFADRFGNQTAAGGGQSRAYVVNDVVYVVTNDINSVPAGSTVWAHGTNYGFDASGNLTRGGSNSGGYRQSTVVGGSGAAVDAFPYANTTDADCGIACIRNIETLLTGGPARSRADIIALLGEPAGTFEDGGDGMLHRAENLNAALNPIGFQATRTSVRDSLDFAVLARRGNIMAVGTSSLSLQGHIVVIAPVAPAFMDVNVYNSGPTTPSGHANVITISSFDASRIPQPQNSNGGTGSIWVITPLPTP
jgi:RHS repeat-associated protein